MATTSKPDLRAQLHAIARGEDQRLAARFGAPVVVREHVERDQAGFQAWREFVQSVQNRAGEPLAAPSVTLPPLP